MTASTPPPPPAFSCETAAAALGHPEMQVAWCHRAKRIAGLYSVGLSGPDGASLGQVVATDGDGRMLAGSGPVAAGRYLRSVGALDDPEMVRNDITWVMQAFQGLPPPYDTGGGDNSLQTAPFRFVVSRTRGTPPESARVGERAVLAVDATGKLAWSLQEAHGIPDMPSEQDLAVAPWVEITTVPAE